MTTERLEIQGGTIAYDDSGGDGALVVMIPGAGDVRAEYRFLAPDMVAGGARVVTVDLRGHGDSSADWPSYGMAETAGDLIALLDHLDAGPATVVGTSFAPAAALWAAAERPDLIERLVLISAHLEAAPLWQRLPLHLLLQLLLRGPLAGRMWAGQFRKWHPTAPPADLDEQAVTLAAMMTDPRRRRAVRQTLMANRTGLEARIEAVAVPTLVIMGGADSHFEDPSREGESIAALTGGELRVIPGAGHYPHVEFPGVVAPAVAEFLAESSV